MSPLTSVFSKTHKTLLKWPGLSGLPFYVFMLGGIGYAARTDPDAGIIEGAAVFYKNVWDTATDDAVTGLGIFVTDTFNFVADTVVPGAGALMSTLMDTNDFSPT